MDAAWPVLRFRLDVGGELGEGPSVVAQKAVRAYLMVFSADWRYGRRTPGVLQASVPHKTC